MQQKIQKHGKKVIFILVLFSIGVITAYCFRMVSYTEFEPTLFVEHSYKKIEVDNSFYQNLCSVLRYDNVKFKINSEGRVLVKHYLNADKELLYNYTEKALDTAWLNFLYAQDSLLHKSQ